MGRRRPPHEPGPPLAVPAGLAGIVVGARALRAKAGRRRRAVAGIVLGLLGLGLWILGLSLSNLGNLSNLSRLQNL